MILEILGEGGIGIDQPLVVNAAQIVIRQDNGTPIAAAACYGPDGTIAVGSLAHDQNGFHRMLRQLGINTTVLVETLRLPKPQPGAKLVASPN